VVVATGSEVHLALAAQQHLAAEGIGVRVVSMPCCEWFDAQPADYRESVLPAGVTARVAVEAGSPLGWWRYVGTHGQVVGVEEFGASGAGDQVIAARGVTQEAVITAIRSSIDAVQGVSA